MEEPVQKFSIRHHHHALIGMLMALCLVLGAAVWWLRTDADRRISALEAELAALREERQELLSQPVMEKPSSAWSLAAAKVPYCGEWVSGSEYKVPAAAVLADLGLGDLLKEGFVVQEICVDGGDQRVAFIAAKEERIAPGPGQQPVCEEACDADVFGTADLGSGRVSYKRSVQKLGFYREGPAPVTCYVDGVEPGKTVAEDRLLLMCGAGGYSSHWYEYDIKQDNLTLAQEYDGTPEGDYVVREGAILAKFHIRRNP